MSLQSVSNEKLLLDMEELFAQERKTSHHILLHLREIQTRRLYAERGYPNMFSMLVHHFHQSEAAANQRLRALELMLDVPVVEDRLVSGELNLSTVALAQRQIRREEKIVGRKLSDAETELFKHLPQAAASQHTTERRISENATRMTLTLPDDVRKKMTRLQELWAHVDPNMDPVEVIDRAFDIALAKVDPTQRKKKEANATTPKQKTAVTQNSELPITSEFPTVTQRLAESAKQRVSKSGKRLTYYGKEFDRQLWEKAGSQCEFVDPVTKKRCPCRFGLQREHVIPLGRGGTNELSNMQLLCSTHNLLRARRVFGNKKIDSHQKW